MTKCPTHPRVFQNSLVAEVVTTKVERKRDRAWEVLRGVTRDHVTP
jgi:hypothetical protein